VLGVIGRNVCDVATRPKAIERDPHVLTVEEVHRLVDLANKDQVRYAALWAFLATTGLRLGEALALRWSDIDFERGTATITKSMQDQKVRKDAGGRKVTARRVVVPTKSKASKRTIELLDITIDILRQHRKRQAEERLAAESWAGRDLVFTTTFGTPPQDGALMEFWSKAKEAAGLSKDLRRHDLRHSYATLSLQSGSGFHETAYALGHGSTTLVASTYGHSTVAMRTAHTQRLNALLEQSS
jgi:integrase